MAGELTVIKAVSAICETVNSIVFFAKKFGYISYEQREKLAIQRSALLRTVKGTETEKLFEHNLELIQKYIDFMQNGNFSSRTLVYGEEQLRLLEKKLEENAMNF